MRRWLVPLVMLFAPLVLLACGDGDGTPAPTTTAPTTTTTTAPTTTTTTTTTTTMAPISIDPAEVVAGCEPLLADCLLPFPSNHLTVADPDTPTGRLVAFAASALPINNEGTWIDPTPWNHNDGFSPGSAMAVRFPDLDVDASGLAPITDIAHSLDPESATVVIDADTGERWPHWTELDANAGDEVPILYLRPARNFPEGHRIVVGIRGLVDESGDTIAPTDAFRAYRDRLDTGNPGLEGRRGSMDEVFDVLGEAGVDRADLVVAWDFTVISTRNLTGPLLSMRDDAFAELGDAAPTFEVASVEDLDDDQLMRKVTGTYTVPGFLTGDGSTGESLLFDEDGAPARGIDLTAPFTCGIPVSASGGEPGAPLIYGHGLLGTANQATSSGPRAIAADFSRVVCGTDLIGMADEDTVNAVAVIQDFSRFHTLGDRLLQGQLNTLFLGRLMIHPDGLATDPAFQDADGQPLIRAGADHGLAYYGISQGGIMGAASTAVSTDWDLAMLGVPAINYSTLLHRSIDFDPFFLGLQVSYPSTYDQGMGILLLQMLWDRGEGNGYANHFGDDPLPGVNQKRVLLHLAVGDHQVANIATEVMARTMGAAVQWPAVADGRSDDIEPYWGLERWTDDEYEGSALVVWDSGISLPPTTNLPPREGDDPHDDPRTEPASVEQRGTFLATGTVVRTCDGPCTAEQR